jgi:hypothetical protein
MLKRNGEAVEHWVPGYDLPLTRSELNAYNEAFRAIQSEFEEVGGIQKQLDKLTKGAQSDSSGLVIEASATRWRVEARLFTLPKSEVLLCHRPREYAVIQRFAEDAPYAKANGRTDVLLTSTDAGQLVSEYAAQAQHTLRFMASNLVAKAQKVIWERFSENNPVRVMRALSERCYRVADSAQTVKQTEMVTEPLSPSRGIRI